MMADDHAESLDVRVRCGGASHADQVAAGPSEEGHDGEDTFAEYPQTSPREKLISSFLKSVRDKVNAQVDAYKTQNLSSRMVEAHGFVKDAEVKKKRAPMPAKLVFFSWWFEEGQRRALELTFSMATNVSLPPAVRCPSC